MKKNSSSISTALLVLALPFAALVGAITNLIIKVNNPSGVDITAGLAYLQPTMIAAIATFSVMAVASIVFAVLAKKQGENKTLFLNLGLLVAVLLICGSYVLVQKQTNRVERDYADQQFSTFFERLKEAAGKSQ